MAKPKLRTPLNTRKACKYFRQGVAGAFWYDKTFAVISDIFETDAELFADMLAATSPNTTVKANVTLALKAYAQHQRGESFHGFMGSTIDMLNKVVNGESFGGAKVKNFAAALKGDLDAVVVDRWMLRAYGVEKDIVTPARYRAIQGHVKSIARRTEYRPAQVQAAIWCGIKLESERFNDVGRIEDFLPFELNL